MGRITLCAGFLLVVGLLGANAVQGPESQVPYSTYPTAVRFFLNPLSYSVIGAPLSKSYVLVPGWTSWLYDQYSKIYAGDLDGGSPSKHRIATIYNAGYLGVAKLCPPLETYTPMNFLDTDFFDFASNTSGNLVYIKKDDLMYTATTDVLMDDSCTIDADNDMSDMVAYYPEMQTCAAYTPDTCTLFFDTTELEFVTEPSLFINAQLEGFIASLQCWDDGTYASTMPFTKVKYYYQDVVDLVDEIDSLAPPNATTVVM